MDGQLYMTPSDVATWFWIMTRRPYFTDPTAPAVRTVYRWNDEAREWWWEHWQFAPNVPASRN